MQHNLLDSLKGEFNLLAVVVDVALLFAMYPAIKGFIATAEANMSAGEILIAGLIPTVLVLALVYAVVKQTGLGSS